MNTRNRTLAIFFSAAFVFLAATGCTGTDGQTDTLSSMSAQSTSTAASVSQQETTTEESIAQPGPWATITLGAYEQDNDLANGKEQIVWLVLARANGKALLLSEKILECMPFDTNNLEHVTWATGTLRVWLNEDFYNAAFSDAEKARIRTTELVDEQNPWANPSPAGNKTNDKVFVLSVSEATNPAYGFRSDYGFQDMARRAQGTAYAISNGLSVRSYENGLSSYSDWWLRTPGSVPMDPRPAGVCLVTDTGTLSENHSNNIYAQITGVRPAIWIDL